MENKKIDEKLYGNISYATNFLKNNEGQNNENYIYVPYTIVTEAEGALPSDTYTKFMAQYKIDHEVCPDCGSNSHSSTLWGYIFNSDNPESYKDENNVNCVCGWKGTAHDLVKK